MGTGLVACLGLGGVGPILPAHAFLWLSEMLGAVTKGEDGSRKACFDKEHSCCCSVSVLLLLYIVPVVYGPYPRVAYSSWE